MDSGFSNVGNSRSSIVIGQSENNLPMVDTEQSQKRSFKDDAY